MASFFRQRNQAAGHIPVVHSGQNQRQVDVIPQGKGIQQVKILKDKAQIFPSEIRQVPLPDFADVLPLQQHLSPGGLVQGGDDVQRVVLPEPDSPMMAKYSPFSTEKFTLVRAGTRWPPRRVLYVFLSFSLQAMSSRFLHIVWISIVL